ncbi:MAG: accessory Sec system glycosyltransferase GtfA [Lachnospiraceae bacterium]|nr:accessory Sec system glycosyltransferase GtfA [Lachnospiraceae bacterium]
MIGKSDERENQMIIYNINRGIGWASSGVEYAQAYRANLLRKAGYKMKFIFTDMFQSENIEHMTKNIGFEDEEVIWLYSFFTDFKIAPTTYTLKELESTFYCQIMNMRREGNSVRYDFDAPGLYAKVYLKKGCPDIAQRVEYVSNGCLIRKDYFTYGRLFSEYYSPVENSAHLYLRRFFNEDGSEAWTEVIDGEKSIFRIGNRTIFSKQRLIAYLIECLHMTEDDVMIIDRATDIGQAVLQYHGKAKVGSVIHAEHYSENSLSRKDILWNNYYEYEFMNAERLDFFITSTDAQKRILKEQFAGYYGYAPKIVTIPVGSLDELKKPDARRKKHSMITASRLASEKHIDWLVMATVKAHEKVPDISLDIYGSGGEEKTLQNMIQVLKAESYIHLMGHQHLDDVYQKYEAYAAGSTSEGFGLTLLEAVGSGLAMIGFDVHYGNQTFVADGENGYLLPYDRESNPVGQSDVLADAMVKLFTEADLEAFSEKSYEIAEKYLTYHVVDAWIDLLEGLRPNMDERNAGGLTDDFTGRTLGR